MIFRWLRVGLGRRGLGRRRTVDQKNHWNVRNVAGRGNSKTLRRRMAPLVDAAGARSSKKNVDLSARSVDTDTTLAEIAQRQFIDPMTDKRTANNSVLEQTNKQANKQTKKEEEEKHEREPGRDCMEIALNLVFLFV